MKLNQRISSIGWLIFIFFIGVIYLTRANISGFHYGDTDFFKFYQAVRFYFAGQNLYDPTIMEIPKATSHTWRTADGNLNPPFLTLILLPLYYFNYATALKIWSTGSILMMFLSTWLVLRPFKPWHKYYLPMLAAFTIYIPNSVNLAYGQISAYLLVLLAGTWLASREKQDILAGLLIGIACAIKIFCGLFLIYFFCIKRFRLLFSALITSSLAFLGSLALFGMDNYFSYRLMLKKIGWYTASWNISFYGVFMRFFSNVEKNRSLITIPYLAETLTFVCCSCLLIYLIYLWRRMENSHFDLGFSLTIIAMLLISPLGWIYYFGLLLIPYLVLIQQSRDTPYYPGFHLGGCIILFFSTLSGDFISTSSIKTLSEVIFNGGVGFYALISFLILYLFLIKEKLRQTATGISSVFINTTRISEKNWFIIYAVAFFPSLMSLFYITRHVLNYG